MTIRKIPVYTPSTEHLLEIKIDDIANTLSDFSDSDNNYTLLENTNYVVRGTLDIPKNTFTVPFLRTDTSRKCYMIATIDDNNNFEIALNFKTGGEWIVNTELLNSELPEPMFRIAEHTFKVV
ncbi:hypothetical protein CJF42_24770 [Pseudoalteromonas sp. NBT06-2]|uniref:hypothetical protein n=1 Tax=Pseudoalteromonas sp. NBT06-2 TaxID=2025950 RepID=UPI000BA5CB75|nr:hypothetical protein [Pseudoalteromonas sp. NBT06-2]PAJ71797.1 hypothetical protein CJF42_24770 [Pseudoalteromonas sp. NBT06-2]